jgi:hypothetical protein
LLTVLLNGAVRTCDESRDQFGCVSLLARQKVGVDPQREGWVSVPEALGDHMDRHAGGEKLRSVGVA